jgi:RND family efflux transporter MFP subunit
MMTKNTGGGLLGAMAAFALAASGCGRDAIVSPGMDVATAVRRDIVRASSTTGVIRGETQTSIRADISGKVTRVLVEPGDPVVANQLLVVIESRELAEKKAMIEHELRVAQLKENGHQAKLAKLAADAADRDDTETDLKVDAENVAYLEGQRSRVIDQISRGDVHATGPGRIATVDVSEGSVVTGANQYTVGSQVCQVMAAESFLIEVIFSEDEISYLKKGQHVAVSIPAVGGKTIDGTVRWISQAARPNDNVSIFSVTVGFHSAESRIKTGMTANVRAELERHDNVLVVPITCLKYREGKPYVQIEHEGARQSRNVSIGITTPDLVELVDGVREGEVLSTVWSAQ